MLRRWIPFLVLITIATQATAQQDPLMKFTKKYFRSNPFVMEFGRFVEHVIRDPQLTNKKMQLRTDSTLFAFNGTYSLFNPFRFKPARVDVALIEQNAQLYEARPEGDTIMLYVIIAYADSTAKSAQALKDEYKNIVLRNDHRFSEVREEEVPGEGITGMTSNFFVDYAQLAPITVEWVEGLTKQPILRLTLRIRSRGNETVVPMSLYDMTPVEGSYR